MTTPTHRFFCILSSLCAFALLPFSGCTSHKEFVPETDPSAPPPATMQGYSEFFDGKLLVEASVGRGFRLRPGKMRDAAGRHGRGSEENPFSEIYYFDDSEAEDQYFIPRMNSSTLPPVALRLRVTNQMKEPVEVEFLECNSHLGNFAVRPEKITVAAGETGAPDPMTSLLGVSDAEFELKIGLKVGSAKETKVLQMHAIKFAKEVKVDKEGNMISDNKGAPPPPAK